MLVGGVIYGGRDGDTSVPVEESFDWEDGIAMKACTLESETTFAVLGKEGVRELSPMANIDFISYPLGTYVENNLKFARGLKRVPPIFMMNYFLRRDDQFVTSKMAKRVWLHWAERRVHGEADAWRTPTGWIPKFEDLPPMFRSLINETYTQADYDYQFLFRCDPWLAKLQRVEDYYRKNVPQLPPVVFQKWDAARRTIEAAKAKYGALIPPGRYQQ